MHHYNFGVAYIGTQFHGWQIQNEQLTVQGELQRALSQIANEPVRIYAAGRTDKGVHATGQVAGFSTQAQRPIEAWLRGLRGLTHGDIAITWLQETEATFHPRYSAVARRYRYLYVDGAEQNIFTNGRAWTRYGKREGVHFERLDADLMHANAQALVGEHDFSTFRGAGCQSVTAMRRVNFCQVTRRGDVVIMDIEANAFLLHMVRNIATGLVESSTLGKERHMAELLAAQNRTALGATAPPQGLYLTDVSYPDFDVPRSPLPTIVDLDQST